MTNNKLGLWSHDDLRPAILGYDGTRYYNDRPKEIQFVHSVAKILAKRLAKEKKEICAAPSLFLLSPVPNSGDVTWTRYPTFSMGGIEVAGRIWVGSEAMNSANATLMPAGAELGAIFDYVSQKLGAGDAPAVLFDGAANDKILRYYPNGLEDPDTCNDVLVSGSDLTSNTLKMVMDAIHEKSLITPKTSLASERLWKNAGKGYPTKEAEKEIQTTVETSLIHALGSIRVQNEGKGKYGRYDLLLTEQDPLDTTKSTQIAILELKVVKSFTSSGTKHSEYSNKMGVVKGIKQAYAYRLEHKSRLAVVCCYDMRDTPDLHKHSSSSCKMAKKADVLFWAWPIYRNAEAARNEIFEKDSSSASPITALN